ncbi:hypothetical protein [Paraglaciecola hydrolytica]|uniref:Copper resistance protein D domain-containing protein n=1 Tax=Paraglaciecola hydrolytica TaxID=1799789 RepID=A0A136A5H5_9ALTE|nr:hypothetical protein [Paraglaciecola hydrolytica]KXI30471.1 hypothetical protein AX660_10940 [Paraglaciecola hydrolytica]
MADSYLVLKLLHLILFVYWLGGDLGTFYASKYVAKAGLTAQQRSTALSIMMGVDQGPRICMALILGPGIQMAYNVGLMSIPLWAMVATWLLCGLWLTMVLAIHFGHGKAFVAPLTRFDFNFRLVIIALCLYFAGQSLLGDKSIILVDFLAWKLIIFAALVACGLGIRVMLKPFVPAFMQMMQQGPNPQIDGELQACLARVRPFVYLIWLGLLVNTALGMHLINP